MSAPIHQLWLYNNWANSLIFDTFKLYPGDVPSSCLHLLSHIVNTQMIWLSRMKGAQSPVGVWEDHELHECERYHELSSAELQQKADRCNDGETVMVTYTNTRNESFRNSLHDILLHVFNHGTYHRAQIATEMRRNGLEPVNTDYITFVRS